MQKQTVLVMGYVDSMLDINNIRSISPTIDDHIYMQQNM